MDKISPDPRIEGCWLMVGSVKVARFNEETKTLEFKDTRRTVAQRRSKPGIPSEFTVAAEKFSNFIESLANSATESIFY